MLHYKAICIEFELFLQDQHFETIDSKIGAFLPIGPLKKLTFDIFFNNYETVYRS